MQPRNGSSVSWATKAPTGGSFMVQHPNIQSPPVLTITWRQTMPPKSQRISPLNPSIGFQLILLKSEWYNSKTTSLLLKLLGDGSIALWCNGNSSRCKAFTVYNEPRFHEQGPPNVAAPAMVKTFGGFSVLSVQSEDKNYFPLLLRFLLM